MTLAQTGAHASFRAPTAFAAARTAITNYLAYRRTYAALDALSDQNLIDLGLTRQDLKKEAYRSAYGR